MAKPPRPWIVSPHAAIEKLEDNLWTVEGQVPGAPFRRRMSIIRRPDGTLLFFNAIPLEPGALAAVQAWGRPSILVIPHHLHGLDATPFAERLGLGIYGPRRNQVKLRQRFKLAGLIDELAPDPLVTFESLDGTRFGEAAALVRSGERLSALFADAYQDYSTLEPPLAMRLLGFSGGPKTPPLFKLLFTTDRAALRAHLERIAARPGLHRLVPCHGPILAEGAAAVLGRVAAAI